jgi:steroid delta-isomerase-like uncharacterized protein
MSEQDNIRIARKTFDALNNHNLDPNDELFARDMHSEATGATGPMNFDQNKAYTQGFIDAFSDLHFTVKEVIAQGERVAVTWVASGTHSNTLHTPMGDTPATQRKVTVPGCTVYSFNQNNQISSQEIYWDGALFMSQLGLMPVQSNRSSTTH